MARNSSSVSEAITNVQDIINEQADLIQQLKEIILIKAGRDIQTKYLWVKFDVQDGEVIEIVGSIEETAHPDKSTAEDGYYYQRITDIVMTDSNNDTYILEI